MHNSLLDVFKTESATSGALGFVAKQVVTEGYLEANNAQAEHFTFCLREIDLKSKDNDPSAFSRSELVAITSPSGCNLALMPLVNLELAKKIVGNGKGPNDVAMFVKKKLTDLGLPIDITIWVESKDCNGTQDITDALIMAGYSIGTYSNDGSSMPSTGATMQDGAIVLNRVNCGNASVPSRRFPTVKIGDNSTGCKIRWISPR